MAGQCAIARLTDVRTHSTQGCVTLHAAYRMQPSADELRSRGAALSYAMPSVRARHSTKHGERRRRRNARRAPRCTKRGEHPRVLLQRQRDPVPVGQDEPLHAAGPPAAECDHRRSPSTARRRPGTMSGLQGMGEPLIVRLPSGGAARRSAHIVSSLDFAPTILAWAGLVYPPTATASGQPVVLTGR